MPLSDGMRQTIKSIGFSEPTPIQSSAIPELLQGKDLLGQAQTGTGKTAAFSVPLIEMVDEKSKEIQALVVCPTRELCLQVCQEIKRLAIHKTGLEIVAVYGGQSIEQQFRALKSLTPQIVVATPGRLFDHLRRKSVVLSSVRMIVLDEADEMLDMGFRPEIEQIFDLLPEENQRIFFSATMPKAIKDLACTYLRDPKIIKTESKTLTVNTIAQSYFRVRGREKTELLCRMLDFKDPKLAVVFCNAKSTADEIVDEIIARGFDAGVLHGDLSQNQRDRVMAKFKSGLIRVLVATDVAARGLDIDDVELVLNYHLPHDPEDYVHRIGRTGRAGRLGCAISLVEPRDNSRLRKICQFAKIDITEQQPPTISDVKSAKLKGLFSQVKVALTSDKIAEYRSFISKQQISAEDFAAGMIQLALRKFDDQAREDIVFEELKDRRYSGYTAETRQKTKRYGRADKDSRGKRDYRHDERRYKERRPLREESQRFPVSQAAKSKKVKFDNNENRDNFQKPYKNNDNFRKKKTNSDFAKREKTGHFESRDKPSDKKNKKSAFKRGSK